MSTSFEFDPVDRIMAGAVGEPGSRVFYIQASASGQLVTLLAEKGQVGELAATLERIVESLGGETDEDDRQESYDLEEPLLPEWRCGAITLEYDDDADRIAIVIREAVPATEDDPEPEGATARLVVGRAQILGLARHAMAVVEAGRPTCNLCGFPIDPEGHNCPAQNGHRTPG